MQGDKVNQGNSGSTVGFSPIEDVIADIAAGKMVIVMDDENR